MADKNEARRERLKEFAQLITAYETVVPRGAAEIGFMLQDFLANAVADADTGVDHGAGLGSFDLWVKVDGVEYLVEIKRSEQQQKAA